MSCYLENMKPYWDRRFQEGSRIWGDSPSNTAKYACGLFLKNSVRNVLVPGSGYGRNTKEFSSAGMSIVGVEVSEAAFALSRVYDPLSIFYNASFLDVKLDRHMFDAVYCYNVLHLFREKERIDLVEKCMSLLRADGFAFFVGFSEEEKSYGKGVQVEENTFESKPGRPVHYFTREDLHFHFRKWETIEEGIVEDKEVHGEEGPHTHRLRYIFARKV